MERDAYEREMEVLFDSVKKKLWLYLLQKVPSQDAEDVFQEVCLHAFTKLHNLEDRAKFLPWVFSIAKRRVLDFYRARYSKPTLVNEDQFEFNLLQDASFSQDKRLHIKELRECIVQLRDPYREVAILHFIVGLTSPEIVKVLELNENTVKSHIIRSRPMILKAMQRKRK